jgi:CrcB protein
VRLALAVALGGACGSWARWWLGGWVQRRSSTASGALALLPAGTLAVNLLGCLIIGFLASLLEERSTLDPAVRIFLLVGVLGGFTTFSSFGLETMALVRGGNLALAIGNVLGSVGGGLAGVWIGAVAARLLTGGSG